MPMVTPAVGITLLVEYRNEKESHE